MRRPSCWRAPALLRCEGVSCGHLGRRVGPRSAGMRRTLISDRATSWGCRPRTWRIGWASPVRRRRSWQGLFERRGQLAFELERLGRLGIWHTTVESEDYPGRLLDRLGSAAPPVLFGLGQRELLDLDGLAVVGSRDAGASVRRGGADGWGAGRTTRVGSPSPVVPGGWIVSPCAVHSRLEARWSESPRTGWSATFVMLCFEPRSRRDGRRISVRIDRTPHSAPVVPWVATS